MTDETTEGLEDLEELKVVTITWDQRSGRAVVDVSDVGVAGGMLLLRESLNSLRWMTPTPAVRLGPGDDQLFEIASVVVDPSEDEGDR